MHHPGSVRAASLVVAMVSLVSAPALAQEKWLGPSKGPPAQTGKTVVYIASDFRNGSVGTVYRGLQEAAQKLGWAKTAATFVIQDAMEKKRPLGVIIFNDNQFAVANAKTEAMKKTIEACNGYTGCRVLAVENVLISAAGTQIPTVVPKLVATHGAAWTYSLAINDVYFDAMNFPLRKAKRGDILNVSAGDGCRAAQDAGLPTGR